MTWRVLAAAMLLHPASALSQERSRCDISGGPQTFVTLPSGQRNTFMGGNVRVRCPTKDLTLTADSLESYGDDGRIYLLGNVRYREPRLSLDSRFLTYYQQDERIVATGDVDAFLPDGSRMRGPSAEYYRAIPGQRPVTRLYASGRPTITLVQVDSSRAARDSLALTDSARVATDDTARTDTLVVIANQVLMLGDSLVYAGGSVIATRPEVEARGDSMIVDSEGERLVIMRNPSILGRGERPFTLSGERIELTSTERQLSRVLSMGGARATSDDMTLLADTIDLRMEDDLLQRAIAWGTSRARANSATQRLVADSIDVRMPDQRVREMHALRNAVAQGDPDTARFRADTVDWMRGDTIIARFDSLDATADSTPRRAAELRELVAIGNARSYYHMAPADSAIRRPAINYVRGREISIAIAERSVTRVTVVEQAAGVYLEPRPLAAPPAAAPDSAAPGRGVRRPPPRPNPRPAP